MSVDTHELRELLLQSDQEFRELALKHHELDDRLHELSARPFLSESEQLEEIQLKKKKLHLKDQMEDMLRTPPIRLTPQSAAAGSLSGRGPACAGPCPSRGRLCTVRRSPAG